MALIRRRVASFGREDRTFGLAAILKADSFLIRLIAFVILGGIFYLVVQMTHKTPRTTQETGSEQTQQPAPSEKQPPTK